MAQVTGTVSVKANGRSLFSDAKAKLTLAGFERPERQADHGIIGFSQKPVAAKLDCTLLHTALSDMQAIADMTDATITFETDTGKIYTLRSAWSREPPELTGGDGEISAKFASSTCIEE